LNPIANHRPRRGRLQALVAALGVALLATLTLPAARADDEKDATPSTQAANRAVLDTLPFANRQDYEDAQRGFVAALPNDSTVQGSRDVPVWSLKGYEFLAAPTAPDTVNPSLWRQAQLNEFAGLFRVTDRVYQVRGLDISNMTLIEGDTGLIIIDPLISAETARAALDLYRSARPARSVVAVIYSHSHVDHFGGVKGVVDEADVRAGKVTILAPAGFMDHAISENVIAGNAMSRRAQYMYGPLLPRSPKGQVDTGLGKNLSRGTITLIPPTDSIANDGDKRVIDGVEIEFQLTPGTEAPSEMNMFFPQFRLIDVAENATHNLHNLYTLRGAEIRDGNAWAKYLNETLARFGERSDLLIAQHHWPTFGHERVIDFVAKQRDLYKYVHDQSVRLMNQGYTPTEIAENLQLPPSLASEWYARGYYGSVSHDAKGVYQKYLGWYDANPADLNPLPRRATAQKTLEYMGGASAVLERARADFARGEYRWVAQVASQVVFAEPGNQAARNLGADALEQLGYQSENATWRNAYLVGASELRHGILKQGSLTTTSADFIHALPTEAFFDYLGVRLNGERAQDKKIVINWTFTDLQQHFVLTLDHSALTYQAEAQSPRADVNLTLERATLDQITLKQTSFPKAALAGKIKLEGSLGKVAELFGLFDDFNPGFPIIEPVTQ
jgi:alkyl sulfatase BDS1-like metallo-beta-lactamase superfamily hydrolase